MATLAPSVRVRPATIADLPAVLNLLLTSYRQFPLFSYLYAPLYKNLDWARDTRFFWRRQLRLTMLQPGATLVIAETDAPLPDNGPHTAKNDGDEVKESSRMLEWIGAQGQTRVSTQEDDWQVCGWAMWMVRKGCGENRLNDHGGNLQQGWWDRVRAWLLGIELSFWKRVYRRKDQDAIRYGRYLQSQDVVEAKFYQTTSYFLDNLCVDFRRQRMGIGSKLLAWGVDEARRRGLPATTEAGPKGEGLYRRFGFKEIGTWTVQAPDTDRGSFDMPVMRLELD